VDIEFGDKDFTFPKYDGYLLMFGIDTTLSHLEAVYKFIVKQTSFKVEKYPMVLVGTKKDLDEKLIKVTTLTGLKTADKYKCSYVEVSVVEEEGVDIAVEEAIKQIELYRKLVQNELEKKHQKKRKSQSKLFQSVVQDNDLNLK
jgi:GTPase SAR1 family protein